jgi:hypothetical protein
VDCEKEIKMYRIIQLNLVEKLLGWSCTFLSLSHNPLVNV